MNKGLEVLKKILGFLEWVILILLLVGVSYIFFNTMRGKAVKIAGYNVLHVITGSMEPTISTGEYVVVKEADNASLKKDDIIAYYSEESDVEGMIVIHRIIKVLDDKTFITKGDANETSDALPVRYDQILGRYKGRVGFLNWLSSFVNLKKILLLLVIIPMFFMSVYEVITMSKLARKLREEDDETSKEETETYEEKVERLKKEAVEEYLKKQAEDNETSKGEKG